VRAAEYLFVLAIVALVMWGAVKVFFAVWRAALAHFDESEPWEPNKHPSPDGGWDVVVERHDERRLVQHIPPAPSWEIQPELNLALRDAEHEAGLLNR
jgi:hypothetical protein